MLARLFLLLGLLTAAPAAAQTADWAQYVDPTYGYRIELPVIGFRIVEPQSADPVLRLEEEGGLGLIEVYGGPNTDGWTLAEFEQFLGQSERVAEVTYRAGGESWLVLSGYYRREGFENESLIFYTKVMFSADRQSFAAFEFSYPENERVRYDPMVERVEDSFSGPR